MLYYAVLYSYSYSYAFSGVIADLFQFFGIGQGVPVPLMAWL